MNSGTNIDFMGKKKLALILSLSLIAISLVSLFTRGLNFGIDFTGGTQIEVAYKNSADLNKVRAELKTAGYGEAIVQHLGSDKHVVIRVAPRENVSQKDISSQVLQALRTGTPDVELRRNEFVGPQVGEELTEKGGLAMLYALIGIIIYIALRFQLKFSLGAVLALVHDVTITLGMFSITQMDFDLTVLAALLAVIGYSLNDTIVVYDRIREMFRKMRKGSPEEIMNQSINQTLSRTLMTSGTTLLVLVALFFLGGEVIHGFSAALLAGIVVGTYSSIYVASTLALMMGVTKQDLMPVPKEGAEADKRP